MQLEVQLERLIQTYAQNILKLTMEHRRALFHTHQLLIDRQDELETLRENQT